MGKLERKQFSISHRMTALFLMLFASSIVISWFYFFSFASIKVTEAEQAFSQSVEVSLMELNNTLETLERHMVWFTSNAEEPAIWDNETPYERLLYRRKMMNELQSFLHATEGAEAVVITQRNSDILLERHTMDDAAALRMLNAYNGRQTILPVSPGVFSEEDDGVYTHLIFSYPIYAGKIKNTYWPTTANLYVAVRAGKLMKNLPAQGRSYLCYRNGDELTVLAERGTQQTTSAQATFSYRELMQAGGDGTGSSPYIYQVNPLRFRELYLVSIWQRTYLQEQLRPVLIQGILLLLCVLLLVLYGNRQLTRQLQEPIRDMLKDVDRIRKGEYDYRLGASPAAEFTRISDGINAVLDELNMQMERVVTQQKKLYELEILNRESQILSLQSQINPHFLYNTLECVISMSRYHNVPEITKIISGMIRIYRYSASHEHLGTVRSEFDCAENYADIMNLRYDNRYQFTFRMEPGLEDAEMPRMVLQPLVENALLHGLQSVDRPGRVEIACRSEDGSLWVSVRDNGCGIGKERLYQLRQRLRQGISTEHKSTSIGLLNVHLRLVNEYGEDFGLLLDSVEAEYTEVTLRMPVRRKEAPDG